MNRVAVIVLNWNGADDTLRCVESLAHQTYQPFTTLVVDNGSGEQSIAALEPLKKMANVELIYNNENLGFAGGANRGMKWAIDNNYSHVALLNNDATSDPAWLQELVDSLDQFPKVGIATGLLLDQAGQSIDSTGEQYSKWGLPFPGNRGKEVKAAPESEYVFGGSGGASLYRATMLKQIGVFDEDFFAYYEDVDLSFRAQLAGWKVYYTKAAIAFHKKGATSKKIPGFTVHQAFKNLPLLFIKNVPTRLLLALAVRFYPAYLFMLLKAVLRGEGVYALKGVLAAIRLTPKKLRARHLIQEKCTVSPNYIKSILWPSRPPRAH